MIDNISNLSVYKGDDIKISDKIFVKEPTILEIEEWGVNEYFNAVHILCGVGADFKWQLWDKGIDYTAISDYDLFLTHLSKMIGSQKRYIEEIMLDEKKKEEFLSKYNKEQIEKMKKNPLGLLLNVDLGDFKIYINKKNNEHILYDKVNDVTIDRLVYSRIVDVVRKIHGLKRNSQIPANEQTKMDLIDDARDEYLISLKDNSSSKDILFPLVSTLCNLGTGYTWFNVWDLKINVFFDCIKRDNKIQDSTLLLQSAYSGFGSLKGISENRLNKYSEI